MTFDRPWVLLLLVCPVLLMHWTWRRGGHRLVMPFDGGAAGVGVGVERVIRALECLPALLLAAAILLLAGPVRWAEPQQERSMMNIQFCLDVSGSMMAPFGDGKRADKAVAAIQEFTTYRKGDAFGLTIFGSDVIHWVPVTKDLSALRLSAPFLRPERMPPYMGGTRIGRALKSVREVLTRQREGDRMVILISDGESSDLYGGQAEEIGSLLAQDRIVVYYIHVAEGAPQNETFTLAGLTGGQAYAAGDPQSLRDVFRRIDGMQQAQLKPGSPERVDFFWPIALAGLVFGGLHAAGQLGLRWTPW